MADLVPYRGSRLPREVQQALDHQDHVALARARRIQNVTFVAEVGLLAVASLSRLESELVRQVPGAELRLDAVANSASIAIAAEIQRLGMSG